MNQEITLDNLDEIPKFNKRDIFMRIFFDAQKKRSEQHSVGSIGKSYRDAELVFVGIYGGRAYKSDECFLRTYYNYLNSRNRMVIRENKRMA